MWQIFFSLAEILRGFRWLRGRPGVLSGSGRPAFRPVEISEFFRRTGKASPGPSAGALAWPRVALDGAVEGGG